uniref:Uncharacterized protein n=1 Tax=Daphnia galeata TaxID=27404 RepID=A0A8J2RK14_9CRUS|nr:unnamed protein product [Daphnia galeata]
MSSYRHEMVRVEQNLVSTVGRDQISFIIENECDLLINSIVPTVQYNKIMDLTTYWLYDYFALVIPVPDETANINAFIKPFQWPIWLGLGVAIISVIAVLYLIQKYFDQPSKQEKDTIELRNKKKTKTKNHEH